MIVRLTQKEIRGISGAVTIKQVGVCEKYKTRLNGTDILIGKHPIEFMLEEGTSASSSKVKFFYQAKEAQFLRRNEDSEMKNKGMIWNYTLL